MDKEMRIAREAANEGGKVLLEHFKDRSYCTKAKGDSSLQTTADLEAERVILNIIRAAFPDHSIKSEESGMIASTNSEYQWLIDPLDGTENFFLGIPYFSTSIALCKEGIPQIAVVYNPVTEELYTAEAGKGAWLNNRTIRASGSTTLEGSRAFFIPDFHTKRQQKTTYFREQLYKQCRRLLDTWSPALDWCLVASGKVDFVIALAEGSMRPDAGTLILEEAGGHITDFYGVSLAYDNNGCIFGSCSERLHRQILKFIKDTYTDGRDEQHISADGDHTVAHH
jgi:myo-inositol-1(or 4)-monophosphatase